MSEWTPQTDNPTLTLAAIRWYAMSIEKLANDIYITHPEQYPEVRAALSSAFQALGNMRKGFQEGGELAKARYVTSSKGGSQPRAMMAESDGCGPGYVNCNGICLPECDNFFEY